MQLICLSFLFTLTFALPNANPQVPPIPPYTTSPTFTLHANALTSNPSLLIANWSLTSHHTGAGMAVAVLTDPATSAYPGRPLYLNGTAQDLRYNTGNVLSDGGTPIFPFGLVVAARGTGSKRLVQINAGMGTPGVGITHFPDPYPRLFYVNQEVMEGPGAWYACRETGIPLDGNVAVYYRGEDEVTPNECVEIELVPWCNGPFGEESERPFAVAGACYEV